MIGLSLSLCISDIIRDDVAEKDVERIVAATCFVGVTELETVIAQYQRTYWSRDPQRGAELARKFYAAGLIDQPRLRGEPMLNIAMGHWAQNERDVLMWPRCH